MRLALHVKESMFASAANGLLRIVALMVERLGSSGHDIGETPTFPNWNAD